MAGILVYSGCSASSNSTRYGNKSTDETHNTSDIRFSSDNDKDQAGRTNTSAKDTSSGSYRNFENDSTDPDDLPESEPKVDYSGVLKNISKPGDTDNSPDVNGTPKERMLMQILKYINTPYKYGGTTSNGIDCSAFTQSIYSKSVDVNLRRTAREQFHEGTEIDDIDDLQFGDLVFFNTRRLVRPGHVGIYIGDHLFVHASKKGVTVSSLDLDYYAKRFMGGRRIDPQEFGSK